MSTTPMGTMEALTCLPSLDLVIQGEARSDAHHLWSLECWSYLQSYKGHSSTLMRLPKMNPIFNMGVNVMRPAFNFEPKYRVTMMTREEWTRGSRTPAVKRLTRLVYRWVQDAGGSRGQSLGTILKNEAQYLSRKICYLGLCLQNSNER